MERSVGHPLGPSSYSHRDGGSGGVALSQSRCMYSLLGCFGSHVRSKANFLKQRRTRTGYRVGRTLQCGTLLCGCAKSISDIPMAPGDSSR